MNLAGFIIGAFFIVFSISFQLVSADSLQNSSMTVSVNILEPIASVSAPSSLDFGNLTRGYSTAHIPITINNTGTMDITITPLLSSSDSIFENLYFGSSNCASTCKKIGTYSINISRPSTMGGTTSTTFYMVLDLTDYLGQINGDMIGHSKNIVFWVMPQ